MTDTTKELKSGSDALAGRVRGPVYGPHGEEYDRERTGFQLRARHRPAVIVGALDERDVRAVVEFASARGVAVAVQATGHGLNSAMEGGVLISTRRMSGVRVNAQARTAWVEAGASWAEVVEAAAREGLAPLSGSLPGVGAVSYTLGGGVGLLARRYGFAADHVHRLDVVTADGTPRQVSAEDDSDLFWALRGGGGNFGVVTGMEIGLVPVTQLYGGGLFFDVGRVPGVVDAWREWTSTVPDEMTSAVSMLTYPDLPMVTESLRGRQVAQVQISYAGSAEEGHRLVRPLRELGPLLRDTLREVPYTDSGAVFDEPDQPHAYRSSSLLLDDPGSASLSTLNDLASPSSSAMCVVGLRHLGGALARAPRVANAVGHRNAAYSLTVLSPLEAVAPWADGAVGELHREAVAPWADGAVGRLLNFSFGPSDEDLVREGYGPRDYRRLTELKARYDPHRVFYCNHPIPPEVS